MEETGGIQDSVWVIQSATQERARSALPAGDQVATNAGGEQKKVEPIRNRGDQGGAQRSVSVRQRQEVQELPHALGGGVVK